MPDLKTSREAILLAQFRLESLMNRIKRDKLDFVETQKYIKEQMRTGISLQEWKDLLETYSDTISNLSSIEIMLINSLAEINNEGPTDISELT